MPLIVITGYPSSGKSSRAKSLQNYFSSVFQDLPIHIVTSEGIDRNEVFQNSNVEKEHRGKLFSELQRLLTSKSLVILDAINNIKGFRYELYCFSKSVKTTQCTLYLPIDSEIAWLWNSKRPANEQYSRETFDALIMRYEDPDRKNRWDSPLFIVQHDEDIPLKDIQASLFDKAPPPPNQSTALAPILPSDFLHDLDRLTQEVVEEVLKSNDRARNLSLAQLSRLRRQFISYLKLNPIEDVTKIRPLFMDYISNTMV